MNDPFQGPAKLTPPASVLRGPADADHFRTKVGRYGDRWYHDPLLADAVWPSTDAVWPSVSTCKKASGSDWSFVALKRVAHALEQRPTTLDGLDWEERYDRLKSINRLGLDAAARRGTNVHLMFEAKLYGHPCPVADDAPGADYRTAVDAFFDTWQPELVAAEFVAVHRDLNGTGYGGTSDAILRIGGRTYLVDYKSRGEDSEHGAYPEEAAQLGAYGRAQYMIVEGPDGPERRPLPDLDGGLIISVKPDGCRIYPVNLDAAFAHWTALHAWWVARRDERAATGKPWAPRKATAPAPVADEEAPPVSVSEGGTPDEHAFAVVQKRYERLSTADKAWIAGIAKQAAAAGVPIGAKGTRTQRRLELLRGLVIAAEQGQGDSGVRSLLEPLVGRPAIDGAAPLGALLGSLDARQAAQFAGLIDGTLIPAVADDGTFSLAASAAA